MRLTTFLIIISTVTSSAKGYSQNINLSLENVPLETAFGQIRQQTGCSFLWNEHTLQGLPPVSVYVSNASLADAVKACLTGLRLSYEIHGKVVYIERDLVKPSLSVVQTLPNKEIQGQITDHVTGKPLVGVTIQVKGTTIGISTDAKGQFSLEAPDNAVLVVSYLGYGKREIAVNGRSLINISLSPSSTALNQLVVVGYGTQKEVNLTGSVASVSGKDLTKRLAPNAADLLEGRLAGLQVTQSSGQPGEDAPTMLIRGLGSFGASTAPLVLIDGIIGDLGNLSPSDIESVTVLKDAASAAIYGARGANGVILVTTKRGVAGRNTLEYSYNYSVTQSTRLPDFITNSVQYMQMWNQAYIHSNQPTSLLYTPDQIAAYQNAPPNSIQYPNYNWVKHFIRNAPMQNNHLGFNGGNSKTQYNFSLNYLDQDGIEFDTRADKWNFMLNVDTRINKTFKVGGEVNYEYHYIQQPWGGNSGDMLQIYGMPPTIMPYLPDGSGRLANNDYVGKGHNRSPLVSADKGIFTHNYNTWGQVYGQADIIKGLIWRITGAFNYFDGLNEQIEWDDNEYAYQKTPEAADYTLINVGNPAQLGILDQDSRSLYSTIFSTLEYTHNFAGGNHLHILLGASQEATTDNSLSGYRNRFPSTSLTQLNAGSATGETNTGDANQTNLRSFFGRINYNYKEKYLLEIDSRYDGSSIFAPGHRWGFFPAASAGWNINKEKLMQSLSWLNEFKIRASYGQLGNQSINNLYPYQEVLSLNQYPFGTTLEQGARVTRLTDPSLHWETTRVTDFGTDIDIKNGLFHATADWYNKRTFGILTTPTVPLSVGLSAPVENYGTLQNRGWEFDVGHRNTIGSFTYSIDGILSLNRNKVLQLKAPLINNGGSNAAATISEVGQPYGSFYMVKWIGIFQDAEEIDKSPQQQYNPQPGDLKYKDINGDGKIDANDRVIIPGAYASYTYSFTINLSWKGFSITTYLQGVQGLKAYVNQWGFDPFDQGTAPTQDWIKGAWTPENHTNAMPALYKQGYLPVDGTESTYFLRDASYLRIKNVQLSYDFPMSICKMLHAKSIGIFISSDNLFTFTKYPYADPEKITGDTRLSAYPQLRIWTIGGDFKF